MEGKTHERAMEAAAAYFASRSLRVACGDHEGHVVLEDGDVLVFAQVSLAGEMGGIAEGFDLLAYQRAACSWLLEHESGARPVRGDSVVLVPCGGGRAFMRHVKGASGTA